MKKFIYRTSRSRRSLWILAGSFLALGLVAGWLGSLYQPTGPWAMGERITALAGGGIEDEDELLERPSQMNEETARRVSAMAVAALEDELSQPGVTLEDVLNAIPRLARLVAPQDHDQIRNALTTHLTGSAGDLAFHYLAALATGSAASIRALEELAGGPEPRRYAHYALGRVALARRQFAAAFDHFHREGARPEAAESRYRALHALSKAKDYPRLEQLSHEPAYASLFTPYVQLELAIGQRDWRQIIVRSPLLQLQTFAPHILFMTLLVGAAWVFFFLHLAELPRLRSGMTPLWVAALVLGALSTVPTLYAVIWQDTILGLEPGTDSLRTVLYYVGGVGLREEACKVLLFLPLLPFLLRRDDEYEALMIASFVGLGFGIEENGNYFAMSQLSSAQGRFLSANFFHAAMTGLNGLALVRGFAKGGAAWNEFLVVFPGTVLVHGLYDAALSLPTLDDTGTIAMALYVLSAWYYFARVGQLRNNVPMTMSLTGAYVVAVSVVAAAMLAFQMLNLGPGAGISLAAMEILGSAIIVYMFLREFREPLTA